MTAGLASIPNDLADTLSAKSPEDALLALASSCEATSLQLARELRASLAASGGGSSSTSSSSSSSPLKRKGSKLGGNDVGGGGGGEASLTRRPPLPLPLPRSLKDAPRPSSSQNDNATFPTPPAQSTTTAHPLTLSLLSSESILSSLAKIASGGSAASSEMRSLESQRRRLDREARDVQDALALREGCARGCDMLACQRYEEAARAVWEVNDILYGRGRGRGRGRGGGRGWDESDEEEEEDEEEEREEEEHKLEQDDEDDNESDHRVVGATRRAKRLCGIEPLRNHRRTVRVLRAAIGEKYEAAVSHGDVAGLSRLTPLLGMLDMADAGVALYLRYSREALRKEMDGEHEASSTSDETWAQAVEEEAERMIQRGEDEGLSRAAVRRRAEERVRTRRAGDATAPVPRRLARIYNAAVTHVRHHLPMVAYALGEAEGDVALVRVVHAEAEKRACEIMRNYMRQKELGLTVRRADFVGAKIEERYAGGGGGGGGAGGAAGGGMMGWERMALAAAGGGGGGGGAGGMSDENKLANMIMGLGVGGDATTSAGTDIAVKRQAAMKDDCGFTIEVGNLQDVDAALEEWALVMQHTESYERFIRHAVDEVLKARNLRKEQKKEESRRIRELEEAKTRDAGDMVASPRKEGKNNRHKGNDDDDNNDDNNNNDETMEILPPHTQLNEVAAEIGGNYSSLERVLLLASMQRAFIHANFPDESTFSPVALSHAAHTDVGSRALQTNLVEECLYAARRSTLRAFATGHTGTASAAANVCVDVLGRVLLEVLTRRAELGASLLRPGEGLLAGQSGLGHAALSFAKSTAGKGFRGVQGAAARAGAGGKVLGELTDETEEQMRMRTVIGVARAAANFNDLEVVAEYTKRLEGNFLMEIDAGYPRGHDTEQLRMCIKGLGGVVESFSHASERAIERLVSTMLPRVRQIVNEAVGNEGGSTIPAASFMGSPVLSGATATVSSTRLDYDLDDRAFELAQLSEGYVGRMCSNLDELIEPLRAHFLPKLSDALLIGILGGVSTRLEAAIRKSKFTPLGAISLDSDVRYVMNFAKDRLDSPELKSNVTLCKACLPLARLNQIALLLNVDDLEDVLDLISVSKRKGNWDLKLDDAKTLLSLRVDFEGSKVNDLLQMDDE